MRSVKKLLAAGITSLLAVAMAVPALPQDPQTQGPVIRSQVSLVNLFVTVRDKSNWRMREAIVNLNNWLVNFVESSR